MQDQDLLAADGRDGRIPLAQAANAVTRMIQAYQEQLISIDELRARIPDLRGRETSLRTQIDALDAQLADREI